jgi:hypothetical protein
MEDEMTNQITDTDLQIALRLTDENIQSMRELEGGQNLQTDEPILCALPLVEVVRLVIGNSIGLED